MVLLYSVRSVHTFSVFLELVLYGVGLIFEH